MNEIWVGTNWKMNKTITESVPYINKLKEISKQLSSNINLFVIPSYVTLTSIKEIIRESNILLGAQNMHWKKEGPYTGEISPSMLEDIGINLVELGHSERRQYYNENDAEVNKKVLSALNYKIKPLICIGESQEEKNHNMSKKSLERQLKTCLKNVPKKQINEVLIAYEPIWAIGNKGSIADSSYIKENINYLKNLLFDLYGTKGRDIPLLYGGSVNKDNFMKYMQITNVNGLFIGRSAWNINDFEFILNKLNYYFLSRTNDV